MELIDLTKILKVGDEVYNIVLGSISKVQKIEPELIWLQAATVTQFGKYTSSGECVIFPSKTERYWGKYIQEKESQKLLEEAKLKYPIGTKVKSAIQSTLTGVVSGNPILESDGDILIEVKDGAYCWRLTIYRNSINKWAEIIKEPLLITTDGIEILDPMTFVFYTDGNKVKAQRAQLCTPSGMYWSTESLAQGWIDSQRKPKSTFTQEQREEIIRLINMYK